MKLLEEIKLTLRLITDDFNSQIENLIAAAYADLQVAGVKILEKYRKNPHPLLKHAITMYTQAHFDGGDEKALKNYEHLKNALSLTTLFEDSIKKGKKGKNNNPPGGRTDV